MLRNKISKKGMGIMSMLGTVVIGLLFLVVILLIFFGGDEGKLNIAVEKILESIRGVPEVDQSREEMTFFQRNDQQIKFLTSWNNEMKYALQGTEQYGGCIMELDSIEADGFYAKDGNYNLYIEQSGEDISMKLTRYAKQNYEKDSEKTEAPVTMALLENANLCIIHGQSSVNFYNELNDISGTNDVPKLSSIEPVPAGYILISSGIKENKERSIGYATTKPADETDYFWTDFFKKKDRTIIYALRLDYDGKKWVCLIPADNDLGSGCGAPSSGQGYMQTDCFDRDGGKRSIKRNLDEGKIPAYLVCNDEPILPKEEIALTPAEPAVTN